MARPRSEEKQRAILEAAIHAVASHGVTAPTTMIAKEAGVAEGTIFRYFPTKDDLLNAVFLHLKQQLRSTMIASDAPADSIEQRARESWNSYVDWGVLDTNASRALNQLSVSDRITAEARVEADALFPELSELAEPHPDSPLADCGSDYYNSVFSALADATIGYVAYHPDRAAACKAAGFTMLWKGMGHP
ncbi:MAG: TetR/AcrR family transcriptional regulator [Proteobacteria bacterium]|nr:TetR/AcrR family transcriptional regulator [Pseudomonadota bacterium]